MARTRTSRKIMGGVITVVGLILVVMLAVTALSGFNPAMFASEQDDTEETSSEIQTEKPKEFQEYQAKGYKPYWSDDARSMTYDELADKPLDASKSDSKENNQKRIDNLKLLPIISPMEGYDRGDYLPNGGSSWPDAEDAGFDFSKYEVEGCDVRRAILLRDGKDVKVSKDCDIDSGNWVDPYGFYDNDEKSDTYDTYLIDQMFKKPGDMDIEHIISLSRIDQSGGQNFTDEEKRKIAIDPDNLIVAAASSNRSKGDQGPAEYMPYNPAYVCTFTEKYTDVLLKYGLGILPAPEGQDNDRTVLIRNLEACMEGK